MSRGLEDQTPATHRSRDKQPKTALAFLVLILGLGESAVGQVDDGPPDLSSLVGELGEQAHDLCEDIEWKLGRSPEGRHLLQDAEEFARAVDGLGGIVRTNPGPAPLRREYREVAETWDHLKGEFVRRGSTPAIARAIRRTDRLVAALGRALGRLPRPSLDPRPAPPEDAAGPPPALPASRRGQRRGLGVRLETVATLAGIVASLIGAAGGIYKYGMQKVLTGLAILLVIGVCLVALAALGVLDLSKLLGGLAPPGRGG